MYKLVLIRHGESVWNKENRFTGWTDVDLSEKGVAEAIEGGQVLKREGYVFDIGYTSLLKRAIKTLWLALEQMDQMWIPVHNHWRLNERHYGALQGLNKAETARQYGDEQVLIWRRSYDVAPPGGESYRQVADRIGSWYRSLTSDTVVAAHGASFFEEIVDGTGLLRTELGFSGLVFTDSMSMLAMATSTAASMATATVPE